MSVSRDDVKKQEFFYIDRNTAKLCSRKDDDNDPTIVKSDDPDYYGSIVLSAPDSTPVQLSVAQFRGQGERADRPTEDRTKVAVLQDFASIDDSQKKPVLLSAVNNTEEDVKTQISKSDLYYSGSCHISVVVEPRKTDEKIESASKASPTKKYRIWTTCLGDSEAVIVKFKKEEKDPEKAIHQRLNKKLHNVQNLDKEDYEELQKRCASTKSVPLLPGRRRLGDELEHDCIAYGRIYFPSGGIQVTRSHGDYAVSVMNRTPDIDFEDVDVNDDEEAFVLVACDGVREGLQFFEQKFVELRRDNPDIAPSQLLFNFLKAAAIRSGDDLSAIMIPLQGETTVMGAIYDGHGGSKIAECVQANHIAHLRRATLAARLTRNVADEKTKNYVNVFFDTIIKSIDNEITRNNQFEGNVPKQRVTTLTQLRKDLINTVESSDLKMINLLSLHKNLTQRLDAFTYNYAADYGRDRFYNGLRQAAGILLGVLSIGSLFALDSYRRTFFYTKTRATIVEAEDKLESTARNLLKK